MEKRGGGMRRILYVFLLIIFSFSVYGVNFLVSPPRFELTPSRNEITKTIKVTNTGNESIHLKAYTMDWDMDRDGTQHFYDAGILPYSCAKWIKINPIEFDVAPGEEKDVRITVITPNKLEYGHWAVVFFESAPKPVEAPTMIMVNARVGSIVYVYDPKYTVRNLEIVNMEDKGDYVTLSLYNKGNVHLRVKYSYKVYKGDSIVYESDKNSLLILPGYYRDVSLLLPELSGGTYKVVVSCDYGGEIIKEGEITLYR